MILVKSYGSKDKEKLCETWSLPFFLMLLLLKRKVIRTCWFRTRRADLHYRALSTHARTLPCLSGVNVPPLCSTTSFFPLHGSFFLKLIWSCRLCHTPHSQWMSTRRSKMCIFDVLTQIRQCLISASRLCLRLLWLQLIFRKKIWGLIRFIFIMNHSVY